MPWTQRDGWSTWDLSVPPPAAGFPSFLFFSLLPHPPAPEPEPAVLPVRFCGRLACGGPCVFLFFLSILSPRCPPFSFCFVSRFRAVPPRSLPLRGRLAPARTCTRSSFFSFSPPPRRPRYPQTSHGENRALVTRDGWSYLTDLPPFSGPAGGRILASALLPRPRSSGRAGVWVFIFLFPLRRDFLFLLGGPGPSSSGRLVDRAGRLLLLAPAVPVLGADKEEGLKCRLRPVKFSLRGRLGRPGFGRAVPDPVVRPGGDRGRLALVILGGEKIRAGGGWFVEDAGARPLSLTVAVSVGRRVPPRASERERERERERDGTGGGSNGRTVGRPQIRSPLPGGPVACAGRLVRRRGRRRGPRSRPRCPHRSSVTLLSSLDVHGRCGRRDRSPERPVSRGPGRRIKTARNSAAQPGGRGTGCRGTVGPRHPGSAEPRRDDKAASRPPRTWRRRRLRGPGSGSPDLAVTVCPDPAVTADRGGVSPGDRDGDGRVPLPGTGEIRLACRRGPAGGCLPTRPIQKRAIWDDKIETQHFHTKSDPIRVRRVCKRGRQQRRETRRQVVWSRAYRNPSNRPSWGARAAAVRNAFGGVN